MKLTILGQYYIFIPLKKTENLWFSGVFKEYRNGTLTWNGSKEGLLFIKIFSYIFPSFAASLEPLGYCRNVASLSLFYRHYFGRCSSKLAQLIPLPYSQERSTHYSYMWHDFSVTIPRCHKDVYVNSFFPRTARLWNSLPIECFPLTYDLNGFKSRINRHLLTVGSFKRDFMYALIFLCFFSCNSMPCSNCSALHRVNLN